MTCVNCNKDKRIASRGLCYACYMRERRGTSNVRRKNGETLKQLLSLKDQSWRQRVYDLLDPHPSETGCIEFLGPKTRGGYGIITVNGLNVLAHRAVHAFNGGDPMAQVVMHVCDNPSCCNPEHLVGGTNSGNMQDMVQKGRHGGRKLGRHLKDRPNHPRARRIVTPLGEFPSAALAAEAVGLHYKKVLRLAAMEEKGFRWVDSPFDKDHAA